MKKIVCLMMLLVPAALHAGDWPQWLGPNRNGASDEKVLPWKDGLKILWKVPVGDGHSSPVVAQGRVFLHTVGKGKQDEELAAFDAESGKPLWSKSYDRGKFSSLFGSGPRATPAVVNGKVYTYGITGFLSCFDAKSGDQVWQVEALKEFKVPNLFFGASCSPLVDGDSVIVNVGGKNPKVEGSQDASIVAVDKSSGKVLWHTLEDKASYSSGISVKVGDTAQLIFLTAKGLVSLAPKDGKVFWRHPLVDKLSESSTTPVLSGDTLFASSVTFGGLALKLDGTSAKEIWMKPELNCYFSTPVAVGKDHFYIVTATRPPALTTNSTLRCIEVATGNELWNRPNVGKYHASLLRTGDGKLLLLEEPGNLVLVDPDPKGYKELARAKVCGETWAHAALANGRLYIRDKKDLVCVQLGQ